MIVITVNKVNNWVQITDGGRKYTCPMKETDGELYFKYKGVWHKVAEYSLDLTEELDEEDDNLITKKFKE